MSSELRNLVTAAYQAILMRDPDPEGLATYTNQLSGEAPDYAAFFASLFGSREFRLNFAAFMERYHPDAAKTVEAPVASETVSNKRVQSPGPRSLRKPT